MADTTEQTQENQQTQQQTPPRGRRQQQNQNPPPEPDPEDTGPTPEDQPKDTTVKRYRCARPCRYRNKAYRVGDILTVYGAQAVPSYFEPAR